jgi:DNA-directed RNA polymerase subunit beta
MYKNRFFQHLWTDLHAVKGNSGTNIQKGPYLIIQQESFFHFIKVGLQTEFQNSKVWFQTSILEWMVYPENLCFEVPTRSYTELIRHNKTYSTRLFLPMLIYDIQNQKIYFEWRSLGNLPVLTQQGHFMVNGSPRVCITQIVRGCGVYRGRELNSSEKIVFYIDFVF